MSRKYIIAIIAVLILIGGYFYSRSTAPAPSTAGTTASGSVSTGVPPKAVSTRVAHVDTFAEEISLVGRVSAYKETSISPLVSGTIQSINVKIGSRVSEDMTLASIDFSSSTIGIASDTAHTAYENSMAGYASTKTSSDKDRESARIQLENAKTNHDNTYNSTDQQLKTAQIQLDTAKDNKDNTYASTEKQLSIAKIQLDNAQSNRDNTIAITDNQLKIAKTQLDNINTQKSNTVASTDESVHSAQIAVDLATKSVDNATTSIDSFEKNTGETMKGLLSKKKSLYDTTKVSVDNTLDGAIAATTTNVHNALNFADGILGVTDANAGQNTLYKNLLGAKANTKLLLAQDQFRTANKAYNDLENSKDLSSTGGIDAALDATIEILNDTSDLYSTLADVLNNTLTSVAFTDTALSTLKTGASGQQSAIASALSSLVATRNGIVDLNNTLSSTQTSLDTTRTSLQTALSISQTQLDSAKQTLKNVQAGNTLNLDSLSGNQSLTTEQLNNTIASIKSTRDSVEKALELAKEQYNSTTIGVKTTKNGVDNALKIAQSQYDSTEIAVKSARDTVDSAVATAQAQYDSTVAKLNAQITSTQTQLDASKGQKDMADVQKSNGFIKAPFDGVILTKNIEIGTAVSPGMSAFTIGDDSQYIVRLDVNADNASHISLGQSAQITSSHGDAFSGSVTLIAPSADPMTRLYRIEVSFSGDMDTIKQSLTLGNYVDVLIRKPTSDEKVISVPFSAIVPLDQGQYRIYVVGSGSIAIPREVKIGTSNSTSIIIREGLSEGERYISKGTLTVAEGDHVIERVET